MTSEYSADCGASDGEPPARNRQKSAAPLQDSGKSAAGNTDTSYDGDISEAHDDPEPEYSDYEEEEPYDPTADKAVDLYGNTHVDTANDVDFPELFGHILSRMVRGKVEGQAAEAAMRSHLALLPEHMVHDAFGEVTELPDVSRHQLARLQGKLWHECPLLFAKLKTSDIEQITEHDAAIVRCVASIADILEGKPARNRLCLDILLTKPTTYAGNYVFVLRDRSPRACSFPLCVATHNDTDAEYSLREIVLEPLIDWRTLDHTTEADDLLLGQVVVYRRNYDVDKQFGFGIDKYIPAVSIKNQPTGCKGLFSLSLEKGRKQTLRRVLAFLAGAPQRRLARPPEVPPTDGGRGRGLEDGIRRPDRQRCGAERGRAAGERVGVQEPVSARQRHPAVRRYQGRRQRRRQAGKLPTRHPLSSKKAMRNPFLSFFLSLQTALASYDGAADSPTHRDSTSPVWPGTQWTPINRPAASTSALARPFDEQPCPNAHARFPLRPSRPAPRPAKPDAPTTLLCAENAYRKDYYADTSNTTTTAQADDAAAQPALPAFPDPWSHAPPSFPVSHDPAPHLTICVCRGPASASARLVRCAEPDCQVVWFHYACLTKSAKLSTKGRRWVCDRCKGIAAAEKKRKEEGRERVDWGMGFTAEEILAGIESLGWEGSGVEGAYGLGRGGYN